MYASIMTARAKSRRRGRKVVACVPHPDDALRIRAAFEAVERGEGVLSAEESAEFLQPFLAAVATK